MDLKKELGSVAEAVRKVMEAELSAKQKSIAKLAEPKEKIDAGDLAKLRAGHKPVKEHSDDDTDKYGTHESTGPKYGIKGKRKMQEDVEQIDEMGYSAKAARAGKDIGKPGKMFGKIAASAAKRYGSEERGKKVAGAILKKLRMKEEIEITDEQADELVEAYEYDKANKMSFSEMLATYKEQGLSVIAEEPTEDEFNKEIKDQMDSFLGKKKQPKLATGRTMGVKTMPEEVEQVEEEQLDELSPSTLQSYKTKASRDQQQKRDTWTSVPMLSKGNLAKRADQAYHKDQQRGKGIASAEKRLAKEETHTQVEVIDMTDATGYTIATIDLDERELTAGESAKKEHIVKSMKKKLSGFKERYGERAKSVMYAVATKMAKEKA